VLLGVFNIMFDTNETNYFHKTTFQFLPFVVSLRKPLSLFWITYSLKSILLPWLKVPTRTAPNFREYRVGDSDRSELEILCF